MSSGMSCFSRCARPVRAVASYMSVVVVGTCVAWTAAISPHWADGGEVFRAFRLLKSVDGAVLRSEPVDVKYVAEGLSTSDSYLLEIAADQDYVICHAGFANRGHWRVFRYAQDRPGYRGDVIAECVAPREPSGGGRRYALSLAVAHLRLHGTGKTWIVVEADSDHGAPNLVVR